MWKCVVAPVIDRGEDGTKKIIPNSTESHQKPYIKWAEKPLE